MGFDDFSPLGTKETGGSAALTMWMEFMKVALEGQPEALPREPHIPTPPAEEVDHDHEDTARLLDPQRERDGDDDAAPSRRDEAQAHDERQ